MYKKTSVQIDAISLHHGSIINKMLLNDKNKPCTSESECLNKSYGREVFYFVLFIKSCMYSQTL